MFPSELNARLSLF